MDNLNSKKRLGKNIVASILYRLSMTIIPLITTPYIARVLGSEISGVYTYTYTLSQYFVILGKFGFENYGNRQIAFVRDNRDKLNKTFSELFVLQLVTGAIALLSYLLFLLLFCDSNTELMWIWVIAVLSPLFNISWFFSGLELFDRIAIRTVVVRILGVVAIFAFVRSMQDLWIYCLINAFILLFCQATLWPELRQYVSFIRVSIKDVLSHLKGCTALFAPIILIDVYRMMDKIMLGSMYNMVETGYYNYADKIVEIPFSLIVAVGVVMIPRMSNLVAQGKREESLQFIGVTIKYNTIAASAIMFGMMAVRKELVLHFLGPGYEVCSMLLAILCPMIIFRSWANVVRTQFLMPNCKDREYIMSLCVGVITNLVLNALLIPRYGAVGASIATLITEAGVAIYQIGSAKNDLPVKKHITENLIFLLFGAVMYVVVSRVSLFVSGTIFALVIQIAVGAFVYLAMLAAYFFVSKIVKIKEK